MNDKLLIQGFETVGSRIAELEQQLAAVTKERDDALQSLLTISKQAGIDEYMEDITQIRGYAYSRATVLNRAKEQMK